MIATRAFVGGGAVPGMTGSSKRADEDDEDDEDDDREGSSTYL